MFLWLSGKNVACSHSRGVEESMTKHKLDNPSKDCVALTKAILPSTCACGPFRLITFSSRLMDYCRCAAAGLGLHGGELGRLRSRQCGTAYGQRRATNWRG